MDAMKVFELCRSYADEARRLNQSIKQRRAALNSIAPPQADPNGGSRSQGAHDKLPRLLADIDAAQKALEVLKQRHKAEVCAACILLDALPEAESSVAYSYYVESLRTSFIAKNMRYSETYVRKLLTNARKSLRDIDDSAVAAALPPWYLCEATEQD